MSRARFILFALLLAAGAAISLASDAPDARLTTNGRDELLLSLPNHSAQPQEFRVPAGAIYATPTGQRVITFSETQLTVTPGATGEAVIPSAALSIANARLPAQPAHLTADTEPRLDALLKYLGTQKDLPRATSQCAVLALLEDIIFEPWLKFRSEDKPGAPRSDEPLLEAIDALGILQQIAPEKTFRLAQDPELKLRALRHPATRLKATQLYGLIIPGDAPPGVAPPNLGQLLHTKPGDNCPICRMRAQMQAPPSDL
jgi:hypothetical protein